MRDFLVRHLKSSDSITLTIPSNTPKVLAHQERLYQVLANLLSNAHHHAGPKAHIWIEVFPPVEGRVGIQVGDDGAGMTLEFQRNAFKPFAGNSSNHGGSGLGLAIVQKLLTAQGVDITMKSVLGRGTEFYFSLPALIQNMALSCDAPRKRSKPEATSDSPKANILLLDDNEDTQHLMSILLNNNEYRLKSLSTITEARQWVVGNLPDLALVDLSLPDGDGLDFCRELKEMSGSEKTKILMFTASAEDKVRNQVEAEDLDGYLIKPFELEELKNTVFRALSHREKHYTKQAE